MENTDNDYDMIFEELKDELPSYMRSEVEKNWGKQYLQEKVPEKTMRIPDCKRVVSPDLSREFLSELFNFDITVVEKDLAVFYRSISPLFVKFFYTCLIPELKGVLDIKHLWVTDIYSLIRKNVLFLPDTKATKAGIEAGVDKPVVLSKNKSNIITFIQKYTLITGEKVANPFTIPSLNNIVSLVPSAYNEWTTKRTEFDIDLFSKHRLVLYVSGKPEDALRMALSDFYGSCQHLYTGHLVHRLLSNVFDKNMKVAYLILDTPWIDKKGNTHPFTPLSRVILRDIEGEKTIFMDKSYPDRVADSFKEILEEAGYQTVFQSNKPYLVKASEIKFLPEPYMDTLKSQTVYIKPSDTAKEIKKTLKDGLPFLDMDILEAMFDELSDKQKNSLEIQCMFCDAMYYLWNGDSIHNLVDYFKLIFGYESKITRGIPTPSIKQPSEKFLLHFIISCQKKNLFELLRELIRDGIIIDIPYFSKLFHLSKTQINDLQNTVCEY